MKSEYVKYRKLGKELTQPIVETFAKHELEAAATSLQLIRRGVMVFDDESESHALMERIMYDLPRGERNVVADFYLSRSPEEFTPDERRLLEAKMKAWFSLFEIIDIDKGESIIYLKDLIRQTGPHKLIDINLAASCKVHWLLATRLVPFGEWCMTSGVCYPFPRTQAAALLNGLKRRIISGAGKKKSRTIPPEDYSRYFFLEFKAQNRFGLLYEDI